MKFISFLQVISVYLLLFIRDSSEDDDQVPTLATKDSKKSLNGDSQTGWESDTTTTKDTSGDKTLRDGTPEGKSESESTVLPSKILSL